MVGFSWRLLARLWGKGCGLTVCSAPCRACAFLEGSLCHPPPASSLSNIEPVCLRCALRCSQCVLRCVPDATSLPPCRHRTLAAVCRLFSPLPLTACLPACLPAVSSSLSSSRDRRRVCFVCTCAPYCCYSIPRHLGSLVPCIPSAAAPTAKLSVYSESTSATSPTSMSSSGAYLISPRSSTSTGLCRRCLA